MNHYPGRGPATRVSLRLAAPVVGEMEVAAIREVLLSGVLTNGPRTAAFEEAFAARHEVSYAVAFSNGTVALAAMLIGLGVGPGDEVIVPSMTFISTATAAMHVGATPVFAEMDNLTFDLDPRDVPDRITERTKAIIAVHYAGQAAPMNELRTIADSYGLILLEDAAQAHGASYLGRPVGGLGDAAMFSFTPTKNITMGEGGVVTTSNGRLAARLRALRNHGQTQPYRHETLGYNWRLTEMQAAMGLVQLSRLDGILARKRANAAWLAKRLADSPGIRVPQVRIGADPTYMIYTILLERGRDEVLQALLAAGIEARVYFQPVHKQPLFAALGTRLPITERVGRRMLSIPFHSQLEIPDLGVIADALDACVAMHGRFPGLANAEVGLEN